ncbi:DMT family transporter [Maribacter algicola]|uniref:DMT family transporter n=1 Tax=Meishania litoralis TaxID=3434685 RepID=A0ACC7LLP4_9FLAO
MRRDSGHVSHLLEINLAMLFISTSGALGRYVDLPVPITIGIRALLAFALLWIYCRWKGLSFYIEIKDRLHIFLTGVLMGLHWIFYFYSLRLSNVAIGMLSLFTYPILTSFLEPLILKVKLQRVHLLLGLLVLFGIYFLVPDFDLENDYSIAVLLGMLSAFFYALRNILLKTKVNNYNGSVLMTYQAAIIGILLLPALYRADFELVLGQWKGLAALALLTTAIGHTLFLRSFQHFSITTASIISSIQPVYGILIGALFLSEIPSWTTIFGGILILGSVIIESVRSYKK